MNVFFLFLIGIFITSFGQLALKQGVSISKIELTPTLFFQILTNKFLLIGFALYGMGSILWLFIIKKLPISVAYPAVSLSYVVVVILSYFFFKEEINLTKIFGISLIFVGIIFLFRS